MTQKGKKKKVSNAMGNMLNWTETSWKVGKVIRTKIVHSDGNKM